MSTVSLIAPDFIVEPQWSFQSSLGNITYRFYNIVGVVLIDEDKALKGGITRGHVKTPQEDGGKYFVNVEAFHQLHCLVSSQCPEPISVLIQ